MTNDALLWPVSRPCHLIDSRSHAGRGDLRSADDGGVVRPAPNTYSPRRIE